MQSTAQRPLSAALTHLDCYRKRIGTVLMPSAELEGGWKRGFTMDVHCCFKLASWLLQLESTESTEPDVQRRQGALKF